MLIGSNGQASSAAFYIQRAQPEPPKRALPEPPNAAQQATTTNKAMKEEMAQSSQLLHSFQQIPRLPPPPGLQPVQQALENTARA